MELNDTALLILSHLSERDVINCLSINKRFHKLAKSDIIRRKFVNIEKPEEFDSYYSFYKHIFTQLTLLERRATIYHLQDTCPISDDDANLTSIDNNESKILDYYPDIKRGDIVVYDLEIGNSRMLIYDGERLEKLQFHVTDDNGFCYGSYTGCIPLKYGIPEEFPIYYWEEAFGDDSPIPFDPRPYIEDLINNFAGNITWFRYNYLKLYVFVNVNPNVHIPKTRLRKIFLESDYNIFYTDEENKTFDYIIMCIKYPL